MQSVREAAVQKAEETKLQMEEKAKPGTGYRPTPAGIRPKVTVQYKPDPTRTMLAAQWVGTEKVEVRRVPAPDITDPCDVIVRNTSVTVCGSDLHLSVHTHSRALVLPLCPPQSTHPLLLPPPVLRQVLQQGAGQAGSGDAGGRHHGPRGDGHHRQGGAGGEGPQGGRPGGHQCADQLRPVRLLQGGQLQPLRSHQHLPGARVSSSTSRRCIPLHRQVTRTHLDPSRCVRSIMYGHRIGALFGYSHVSINRLPQLSHPLRHATHLPFRLLIPCCVAAGRLARQPGRVRAGAVRRRQHSQGARRPPRREAPPPQRRHPHR